MLIRVKHTLTSTLRSVYKADKDFAKYFPDKFHKAVPDKRYFWRVLAMVKLAEYDRYINKARTRLVAITKSMRNSITLTDEAIKIFEEFSENDLNSLSELNSERQ